MRKDGDAYGCELRIANAIKPWKNMTAADTKMRIIVRFYYWKTNIACQKYRKIRCAQFPFTIEKHTHTHTHDSIIINNCFLLDFLDWIEDRTMRIPHGAWFLCRVVRSTNILPETFCDLTIFVPTRTKWYSEYADFGPKKISLGLMDGSFASFVYLFPTPKLISMSCHWSDVI